MMPRFVQYLTHDLIIVVGIVVEQNQPIYIALASNSRSFQPCTVAVSFPRGIFLWGVLSIVNQHVGILSVFPQDFVEPDMSVLKITGMSNHFAFRFDSVSGSALEEGKVITHASHFAFRFDSVSGSALEVMKRKRMYGYTEVAKRIAADIHQGFFRGRILETDRIVGTRHLPFQNL